MKFLKALFSEHGSASMMRVMSLLSLFASIAISIIGLNKPTIDYSGLTMLVGVFLTAAFGGKVAQKKLEINGTETTTDESMK